MRSVLLLLVASLVLAACAGFDPMRAPGEPVETGPPAYETFDPSAYDAEPPAPEPEGAEIRHDVPAELMAGRVPESEPVADQPTGPVTIQGFRIQLFSSEAKPTADRVRDDFVAWWRTAQQEEGAESLFPYGSNPVVVFTQPLYRVRVGVFATRAEAEPTLDRLRERFPEAFLVPDTITVDR